MKPVDSGLSAKSFTKCCISFLVVTALALAFRLPRLEQRPMHCDEAIHGMKLGQLLEKGVYTYDPNEYHGPTLNYFTLIPAWLSSAKNLTEINEFTLRIVPVFFGVLLVLMTLLLADGLGRPATIIAAVMATISPAFVFYSRYYIQEMLLVCFTFGAITCGWRYTQSKKIGWVLLTGMFLGLMHATKETCIIAFGSMFLALLIVLLLRCRDLNAAETIRGTHLIIGLAAAVVVSVLFYSSFFTNPGGIWDSVRTYTTYFSRSGNNSLHIHPWYYYLDILTHIEGFEKLTWNEDFIVVMAAFGFIVMFVKRYRAPFNLSLLRFLAFYTLIMTIVYSAIPYKTPWCLLGFLHGMILLAAVGTAVWIKMLVYRLEKLAFGFILVIFGLLFPAGQAYLGSYKYYADPRNPYVYAHPTTDVFAMVRKIEEIAGVNEDGFNMYIQVICPNSDYWPLPWYLRRFTRVGYWDHVDMNELAAPVIIASASVEQELVKKLYELPPPGKKNLYVPLFDTYMELRPQIELRGYVIKDLWDRFQQSRAQSIQSQTTGEK